MIVAGFVLENLRRGMSFQVFGSGVICLQHETFETFEKWFGYFENANLIRSPALTIVCIKPVKTTILLQCSEHIQLRFARPFWEQRVQHVYM